MAPASLDGFQKSMTPSAPTQEFDFGPEKLAEWTRGIEAGVARRHGFEPNPPLSENPVFHCLVGQAARRRLQFHDYQKRLALLTGPLMADFAAQVPLEPAEVADGMIGFLLAQREDAPDMLPPDRSGWVFLAFLAFAAAGTLFWRRDWLLVILQSLNPVVWLGPAAHHAMEWLGVLLTLRNFLHCAFLAAALWFAWKLLRGMTRRPIAVTMRARLACGTLMARKPLVDRIDWGRLPMQVLAGAGAAAMMACVMAFSVLGGVVAGWVAGLPSAWAQIPWMVAWGLFGFFAFGAIQVAWLDSLEVLERDPVDRLEELWDEWRREES